MTTYVAPIRDMLFAMNELAGLAGIGALPGNEEATLDVVESILLEAAKFATEVLAPINAQGDRQGCACKDGEVTRR
ncbi:MAG: acyl-CoA dehydrogenase N-terminal domain-containing protein [Pseudomonadales bacterium]